jgi:cytochrome c oxidase cbb3-type subunit 4
MDYGIVGSIFTVVVFVAFIGIVVWAMSGSAKARFDQAEKLVFDDEPSQQSDKKERES